MKIKKLTAAAAAIAVLAVAAPMTGVLPYAVSMTASAAEEKLITSPYPDGITGWNFYALGNGYYYTQIMGKDGRLPDKVIRVGDKEIEEWRKTGKFTYTDVESEVDLSNIDIYDISIQDGYACLFCSGDKYYVMKVDESANKLVKVYEFSDGRNWSRTDGYSFSVNIDSETGVCTYTVYDPNGQKIENTLTYTSSGKGDFDQPKAEEYGCYGDKYVGYMTWMIPGTVIPGSEEEPWNATAQFDIYGIKKDGSRDVIAAAVNGSASAGPGTDLIIGAGDNYVAWKADDCITIYTVDDGKTYKLTGSGLKYGADGTYSVKSVFGSKAVISASDNSMGRNGICQLVDISGEGKVLLDEKLLIEPVDNGDMFYVSDQYYKAGFFDSTGKKISEGFDNVANFNGDNLYTAAYKDGKACIIDRNMNQVSEMFDASELEVRGNEFFKYDVVGERGDHTHVFATFANKVETDQPTKPTTPDKPPIKTVEYADKAANISAFANEGVIADGAKLSAAAVADKTDDKNFTYDISFKKDDKNVQPNGAVTVKIPVPEAIKDKPIYVYRVDGGKYYDMGAKVENGFVVFETDHFSEYLVTTEKNENAVKPSTPGKNPATGVAGGVFGIMAIAGAVMIVSKKRR